MKRAMIWGMALVLVACMAGMASAANFTIDMRNWSGSANMVVRNPMPIGDSQTGIGISGDTVTASDVVTDITRADGNIYTISFLLHDIQVKNPVISGFTGRFFKGYVDVRVTAINGEATDPEAVPPLIGAPVVNIPVMGIQTGLTLPAAIAWSFAAPNRPANATTGATGNNRSPLGLFQARTFSMASTMQFKTATTIPILQSTATIAGVSTGPFRLTGGPVVSFPSGIVPLFVSP